MEKNINNQGSLSDMTGLEGPLKGSMSDETGLHTPLQPDESMSAGAFENNLDTLAGVNEMLDRYNKGLSDMVKNRASSADVATAKQRINELLQKKKLLEESGR